MGGCLAAVIDGNGNKAFDKELYNLQPCPVSFLSSHATIFHPAESRTQAISESLMAVLAIWLA